MKLKGIMETSLGGFLTFRGFADFEEIARISKPDDDYQRGTIEQHSKELQDFLERGENLFFPELVLGCYLPEDEEEIQRLEEFIWAFQDNQKGNFGFKKLNIGIKSPQPYGDSSFKVATLSTRKERNDANIFFRIDGNHRITAFECLKNKPTQVQDRIVAICIIFFRTKEEYSKQAKIIFHNLNFKAVPLSMEQNLQLIFEDNSNFPDEKLKDDKAFGLPYYYAKKASKLSFAEYFKNLENIFDNNKRSSFLDFFKFLEASKVEIEIEDMQGRLSSINEIFKDKNLKETNNTSLFFAFLFYAISSQATKKIELFKKWVLNNHIYKAKMDLASLVHIFDEIYNSRIQKVFVAMAFKNTNNIWSSIVDVYNELVAEGYELSKEHQHNQIYLPYRVDKEDIESKDIIEKIKNGIKGCDLMIADLTYSRPNVYYEIGLAEGQNKPLILLFDENENMQIGKEKAVHFDLITKDRIKYSSNDLEGLKNDLKCKLKNILENICKPIRRD